MKKHEEKTLKKKLEATLLELGLIRGKIKKADSNGQTDCVTCSLRTHWTNLNGGHCIQQAKGKACKFLLDNINAQCSGCNGKANQGQQHLHAIYIAKEFGEDVCNDLFVRQHFTFKPTIEWLDQRIQEVYRLMIKWYISNNKEQREYLVNYMKKPSRKAKLKDILEILNGHNE